MLLHFKLKGLACSVMALCLYHFTNNIAKEADMITHLRLLKSICMVVHRYYACKPQKVAGSQMLVSFFPLFTANIC